MFFNCNYECWFNKDCKRIRSCKCGCNKIGLSPIIEPYLKDGKEVSFEDYEAWLGPDEFQTRGRLFQECLDTCQSSKGRKDPKEHFCEDVGDLAMYRMIPKSFQDVMKGMGCPADDFEIPETGEELLAKELEKAATKKRKEKETWLAILAAVLGAFVFYMIYKTWEDA